jgi:hypothetical protein
MSPLGGGKMFFSFTRHLFFHLGKVCTNSLAGSCCVPCWPRVGKSWSIPPTWSDPCSRAGASHSHLHSLTQVPVMLRNTSTIESHKSCKFASYLNIPYLIAHTGKHFSTIKYRYIIVQYRYTEHYNRERKGHTTGFHAINQYKMDLESINQYKIWNRA